MPVLRTGNAEDRHAFAAFAYQSLDATAVLLMGHPPFFEAVDSGSWAEYALPYTEARRLVGIVPERITLPRVWSL